ncbi:MAG TPA: MFS transporter [Nanoarchaeota archaeon]|nr:MFS transporter [Nanoarchaeota archaeon]
MLFKKGELKELWPFYLYYLIFGLSSLIMPFMIIYFRDLNFSFLQIAIIISGFSIGQFLFEVPTGAFADGLSRKVSVIIGFLMNAFAILLFPLFDSPYALFALWTFSGIGMSFISGAEEAWVVDNLHKAKKKELQQEYFIKAASIAAFGAIFAPLLGALFVKSHPIKWLWLIFGAGFLINAIILSVFAKELYKPKRVSFLKSLKETFKNGAKGIKFTFSHKVILLLVLGGAFAIFMEFASDGWQPLLVNLSMPKYGLGIMFSVVAAVSMVVPFLSRLLLRFKIKNVIAITILLNMILLFSLIFLSPPMFMVAAIIFVFNNGIWYLNNPLLQSYLHKFIPTKIRATVISTKSMFNKLVIILGSLAAGVLMDYFGPQKVIAFGGFFGIFAIWCYLKIKD